MATDFSWITSFSPSVWIQGLFGGAGATLLWEGVVKPGRERRSLAHVLAEEIASNLNVVSMQLDLLGIEGASPEVVRPWSPLSSIVFQATLPRVGELPRDLVSKVVGVYRVAEIVNRWQPMILAEWDDLRLQESAVQPDGAHILTNDVNATQRINRLRELLAVFKDWLNKFKHFSDKLLPELRKASVPWYRLDLRIGKHGEYIFPELETAGLPRDAPK